MSTKIEAPDVEFGRDNLSEAGPSHTSNQDPDEVLSDDEDEEQLEDEPAIDSSPKARSKRPLSLDDSKAKKKQPTAGIIYISRLPPGMTPQKVKHLMSGYGPVGRIYAQHKDNAGASSSSKPSKSKPKHLSANYSEAWLEFLNKSTAKTVADMLNAQLIGGKKGDRWRDDIWTMKYLSGFRWEMLGEQVAYERQAHQHRLRQSLSQSKTAQADYLRNVELARVLDKRRAKKEGRAELDDGGVQGVGSGSSKSMIAQGTKRKADSGELGSEKAKRKYRQRELGGGGGGGGAGKQGKEERGGRGGEGSGALGDVLEGLF